MAPNKRSLLPAIVLVILGTVSCKSASAPPPRRATVATAQPVSREMLTTPDDEPPAPGGAEPCEPPPGSTDVTAAARHCYERRVKPALASLADAAKRYRFGHKGYIAMVLALEPKLERRASTGEQLRRHFDDMPMGLLHEVTVLGDLEAVEPAVDYQLVHIVLRSDAMPADGHAEYVFVVDPSTLRTLFVFRLVSG